MKYCMRMLKIHRRHLRELLSDKTREQACFLVCSVAQGRDKTILLVREVHRLEKADLRVQAPDELSVSPQAMLRVVRRAQDLDCSVCMVHTHPMSSGAVAFSQADDIGNQRTFDFLSRMLPGRPNSCLVWDRDLICVAGRVYRSAKDWAPMESVAIADADCRHHFYDQYVQEVQVHEQYARQAQLLGREGQQKLQDLKVVIVGSGGIGSVAGTLLAHSGVTNFDLIDFDHLENSNLPRIVGATSADVASHALKTTIVSRYILSVQAHASVQCYTTAVENEDIKHVLASADLVICGTDDTTSRAYLNQLCHQYYVPVMDLGVQFGTDDAGKLIKEVGRVHFMLPGTACLCCTGHIDPHRLSEEGLSQAERESMRKEGYISGADVPEPSMMVFNMQVVARGIQRVIEWVTGLSSLVPDEYEHFRFIGLAGASGIKTVRKHSSPSCPICHYDSGLIGLGDSQSMLVRPRPRVDV